jgi:hypothetical protein
VDQIYHIRFTEDNNMDFSNLKCYQEMSDNGSKNLLPTHTLRTHEYNYALTFFCVTNGKKNQQSFGRGGGGGRDPGNRTYFFSIFSNVQYKQDRLRTSLASLRGSPCPTSSETTYVEFAEYKVALGKVSHRAAYIVFPRQYNSNGAPYSFVNDATLSQHLAL